MIRYIILIIEINAKWKDRVKYFSQIKKQRTQGQVLCLQKLKKTINARAKSRQKDGKYNAFHKLRQQIKKQYKAYVFTKRNQGKKEGKYHERFELWFF